MGIDATGWFDIEGVKITKDFVTDLTAKFLAAEFDLPKREWFCHKDGYVKINFDMDRYYGPGYERGPCLTHVTVLGWLLRNLPSGSRIFFGGDCSDFTELPPWDLEREKIYLDRYFLVGHEPYTKGFSR